MSQQRSRLINGAALVAVVGVFGCQPMVPSAPATQGAAPAAPSYELQAARPNEKANANSAAAVDPCGVPPYTVTAKNPNALLTMAGTRNEIHGNVWTNDGIRMTGNREVITGDAHYRDAVTISGKSNYIAGARVPETGDAAFAHPSVQELLASGRVYSFDTDVDLWRTKYVWQSPGVLRPGIYYSTGKIVISQNGVKGNVTLIGSAVQLPGKRHDLTAYAKGVLAYATGYGANAIHVAGVLGVYQGAFITPNGEFQMTGHYNRIKGTVWCDSFKLSGGYNHIVNAGTSTCATTPPSPEPSPSPVPSPSPSPAAVASPSPSPSVSVAPSPSPLVTAAPPSPEASQTPAPVPSVFITEQTDFEPQDVVSDAQSYMFTANKSGRSSNKLTPTGTVSGTPLPFGYALNGVAVAADKTLWAVAYDESAVLRWAPGAASPTVTAIAGNPTRIRIDKLGFAWTTTSLGDTVLKYNANGTLKATYTLPTKKPMDVTFDANNNAFVSCKSGNIVKIAAGAASGTLGAAGIAQLPGVATGNAPAGITIDTFGNIWMALTAGDRVAKIVPTGTGYTQTLYFVGDQPIGIAADDEGFVWVSNAGSHNAMRVAQDGAIEDTISTGTAPNGVWFDKVSRKILIANQISRTVTVITP